MQITLPSGYISNSVIELLNMVLAANSLPAINRQDRIRGYIAIPTQKANDIAAALKAVGLVA